MSKADRQSALLDLIERETISSQWDLARRLSRSGVDATQASVSRDLAELGIAKVNGRYVNNAGGPNSAFGEVTFALAGNCLIVGRCASGLASAVTVRIDSARIDEIVGTIAGDDTVFIAVKDAPAQKRALERLRGLF